MDELKGSTLAYMRYSPVLMQWSEGIVYMRHTSVLMQLYVRGTVAYMRHSPVLMQRSEGTENCADIERRNLLF
jgi:hypothetical protein